jgi:hypothetical protein
MEPLKCSITYYNGSHQYINFRDIPKENYSKVKKIRFMVLNVKDLEKEIPEIFDMENITCLETGDTEGEVDYPDKMGNFLHLDTLKVCHLNRCTFVDNFIHKNGNKAIIRFCKQNMIIPCDIEYLNILIGWFDDKPSDYRITTLDNLHNGLKYLQISVIDFDILKYINNLPPTLETFNVVITLCAKDMFYDTPEDYTKHAIKEFENIKVPFNCVKNLKIEDLEINYTC